MRVITSGRILGKYSLSVAEGEWNWYRIESNGSGSGSCLTEMVQNHVQSKWFRMVYKGSSSMWCPAEIQDGVQRKWIPNGSSSEQRPTEVLQDPAQQK
jgi:hypothetical protein